MSGAPPPPVGSLAECSGMGRSDRLYTREAYLLPDRVAALPMGEVRFIMESNTVRSNSLAVQGESV